MMIFGLIIVGVVLISLFLGWLGVRHPGIALAGLGLLTGLVVYLSIFHYNMSWYDEWMVLLGGGIFVVLFTVLSYWPRRKYLESANPEESGWRYVLAIRRFLFAILILIVAVGLPLLLMPFGIYLLIINLVLLGGFVMSTQNRSRRIAYDVIYTLSVCMRQNMPLVMALRAEQQGKQGVLGEVYGLLIRWLEQGERLSVAMGWAIPQCPAEVLGMIRVGEETHRLGEAVDYLKQDYFKQDSDREVEVDTGFAYFFTVLFIIISFLAGFMVLVVPRYVTMLSDMGLEVNWAMGSLIQLTRFLNSDFSVWVGGLVLIGILWFFYGLSQSRKPGRGGLTMRVGDGLKWLMPGVHWLQRNRAMKDIFRSLSLSLRSGDTVDAAIERTLTLDMNYCMWDKINRWGRLVEQGEDVALAARRCGVGTALEWVFDDANRNDPEMAVLSMMVDVYTYRFNYVLRIVQIVMDAISTLVLGAIVGFITYAMFSPIVDMIYGVMGGI